jgi:hypothetical protein
LDSVPNGLFGIYGRILLRIENTHRQTSALILLWAALAARTLSTSELADAIDLETSNVLNRERTIRDHVARCKPIITVRRSIIVLIHQSAQDYLLRPRLNADAALETFRINPEEAHFRMAQSCLRFLEQDRSHSYALPPSKFWQYALRYWSYHAQHAGDLAEALYDMSRPIFQNNMKTLFDTSQFISTDRYSDKPHLSSSIHKASFYGLSHLVRKLLSQRKWWVSSRHCVGKKDWEERTPLHLSAVGGHAETTQLRLENGANIPAESDAGIASLAFVALGGHASVVQLLLRHGANINHVGCHGTPLIIVCIYRNTTAAHCLIDHGPDVNSMVKNLTALHFACFMGVDNVVGLLLSYGADVNRRGPGADTPLTWAVSRDTVQPYVSFWIMEPTSISRTILATLL